MVTTVTERNDGRPLAVAIDARMWRSSGIGVYLRNITERLLATRPDWRFKLLVGEGYDGPDGGSVSLSPMTSGIYSVGEQIELARATGGADVVWSPHYNAALLARAPLVVTMHDVAHLVIQDGFGLAKKLYARAMYPAVRLRADHFLFVSAFSQGEFIRRVGPLRQPSDLTPNAVAGPWLRPGTGGGRPRPGRYAVVIGNPKPNKNLPRLMQAFRRVAEQSDLDLVVIGKRDGFLTADEGIAAAAAGLGERVQFTGYVSDEDLVDWVRHATLLVMPSLYEGFGIPPLEAMSVSCPTVVSDIGAHRETCGEASEYVDPQDVASIADGILRVAKDPARAADLVRRGLERVSLFDWDRTAATAARALAQAARRRG